MICVLGGDEEKSYSSYRSPQYLKRGSPKISVYLRSNESRKVVHVGSRVELKCSAHSSVNKNNLDCFVIFPRSPLTLSTGTETDKQ